MKPFCIIMFVPTDTYEGNTETYVVMATDKADAIARLNFNLRVQQGRKNSWELASEDETVVEIDTGKDIQLIDSTHQEY